MPGTAAPCCGEGHHDLPLRALHHRQDLLDLIKSCGKKKDLHEARKIHAHIILHREIFLEDICIRNAILSMYTRCGSLQEAREVFDADADADSPMLRRRRRNVVSWNTLISGYAENGLVHEAMECYAKLRDEKLRPNKITFVCLLKACSITPCLEIGEYIRSEIEKEGFSVKRCVAIGTALLDMYAKCGALSRARESFDELSTRNAISWGAMITGYVRHGLYEEAITLFRHMKDEGISPNASVYTSVLKACGHLGYLEMGEEIHEEARNRELLQSDIILATSLLDMYAKCGSMLKARDVFDSLPVKQDSISWNALIGGYSQHELHNETLECFRSMCEHGVLPDSITYICVLKACGGIQNLNVGESIHARLTDGLLEKDIMLCTALLDMYVKCNSLQKAHEFFDAFLLVRDVVSWNILIVGYVRQGLENEALRCFFQMQSENISPDALTFTSILKACGSIGYLEIGEKIHHESRKEKLVEKDGVLGAALVEMYVKCGMIQKAQQVLDELPIQNIESRVALMDGYAHLGQLNRVLSLFEETVKGGMMPNGATFLALLNACNHAGLVKEGQILFEAVSNMYCLMPGIDHYVSMVGLFSRAGCFNMATIVMDKMPSCDYLPLWIAFLGACCKWVDVEHGRWAFEKSILIDGMCSVPYVYMRNIYAAAGMHSEAERIEIQREKIEPVLSMEHFESGYIPKVFGS